MSTVVVQADNFHSNNEPKKKEIVRLRRRTKFVGYFGSDSKCKRDRNLDVAPETYAYLEGPCHNLIYLKI